MKEYFVAQGRVMKTVIQLWPLWVFATLCAYVLLQSCASDYWRARRLAEADKAKEPLFVFEQKRIGRRLLFLLGMGSVAVTTFMLDILMSVKV